MEPPQNIKNIYDKKSLFGQMVNVNVSNQVVNSNNRLVIILFIIWPFIIIVILYIISLHSLPPY